MSHTSWPRAAARFGAVAAAYFLASLVGVAFVVQPEHLAVFWPAGGLALGYLLVTERRHWAGAAAAVFVGNLGANLAAGHTALVSAGFAVVNAVEPLAAAWVIGRMGGGPLRLDRFWDVVRLFAGPPLVCMGTALVGAGLVTVGLGAPSYWGVWKVWWLADALGAVLFAPLVVAWGGSGAGWAGGRRRVLEAAALIAALGAVTWGIFVSEWGDRFVLLTMSYPVFPFVLWVAVRMELRGAAVAIVLVSLIAASGTLFGRGPLGRADASAAERVLVTQGFAAVVALSSLVLVAALRERRAAMMALWNSEQRFRAIFHSQFQFVGLMSPTGALLEANRTSLAAAGVPEAEAIGKPFWETPWWTHDPAQQERLRAAVRRAAGGQIDRFEASHPAPDGTLIWVDFSLTPFADASGNVVYLIPEGRDVSARKRVELALQEKTQLLGTVLDSIGDAVLAVDRDGRMILRNPAFHRLHEGQPEPGSMDQWARARGVYLPGGVELCPVEQLPMVRAIRGEPTDDTELEIVSERHPDGIAISVTGRPLSGPQGVTGGVLVIRDVSARKRAAAALRESEERFRVLAANAPVGIFETDAAGACLFVNERWCELAGMTPDEAAGDGWMLALHPDDLPRVTQEWYTAAEQKREFVSEYRFISARGRVTWLSGRAVARLGAGGAVRGYLGTIEDITVRRANEVALRESEERFRSAFEFAPIGIALVSPAGAWLRVNRAICDIVGYTPAELLAIDFPTITHPDDLETDLDYVRQVLAGALPTYQMEKRYFHKRGHVVDVLLSVSLVRDAAGAPLYFISQVQDISARKEGERALKANQSLLSQFITHSPAAIAMFDRDVRYVQTSDRWLIDYNLGDRNLVGASHYDVFPDIPDRWKAIHQRVLAGAVERCDEDAFHRTDGSIEWLQWECRPWHTAAGAIGGLIMFTQVVTMRKRAEEHVKASLREKEVLLKEIHHRVKNNLQIVSALLDLQSGHTSDPQALEMFQESRGRVKSMALIHERLYRSTDLARVNFAEYVRLLADDLYRTYRVSDDDIALEVEVDVPPLPIDIAIPCGLLLNELVSNCLKHAFRGAAAGLIRVSLTAERDGTNVLVVADDGAGFPAGTDFRNTTSFGLQLVTTLIEQLDGTITLTGGRGATFTVRFASEKK